VILIPLRLCKNYVFRTVARALRLSTFADCRVYLSRKRSQSQRKGATRRDLTSRNSRRANVYATPRPIQHEGFLFFKRILAFTDRRPHEGFRRRRYFAYSLTHGRGALLGRRTTSSLSSSDAPSDPTRSCGIYTHTHRCTSDARSYALPSAFVPIRDSCLHLLRLLCENVARAIERLAVDA